MRRLSCVVLLGVLMSVTVGVPPSSAASGETSSSNGVLFEECLDHAYGYDIDPDHSEWELEVDLIGPDGSSLDRDFYSSARDSTSGSGGFLFCGAERVGSYQIEATLTSYDAESNSYVTRLPASTFRMREPRSRTRLRVSDRTPHYNEVVRFRSKSVQEMPRAYVVVANGAVKLQVKTPRGWANVTQSKTQTNDRGVAVWRYRWDVTRTLRLRAVTLRSSAYSASNSKAVSVDTTANGRRAVSAAGGLARAVSPRS